MTQPHWCRNVIHGYAVISSSAALTTHLMIGLFKDRWCEGSVHWTIIKCPTYYLFMIPVAFKSRPEKNHQLDVVLVSTMFFENHAWFSENSQYETVITNCYSLFLCRTLNKPSVTLANVNSVLCYIPLFWLTSCWPSAGWAAPPKWLGSRKGTRECQGNTGTDRGSTLVQTEQTPTQREK